MKRWGSDARVLPAASLPRPVPPRLFRVSIARKRNEKDASGGISKIADYNAVREPKNLASPASQLLHQVEMQARFKEVVR